jgi:hypothetical protein
LHIRLICYILNQVDPIVLFAQATTRAADAMGRVRLGQLTDPTPCTRWRVQDLVEHMVGSTDYLLGATGAIVKARAAPATVDDYRVGVARVLDALQRPGDG